MRVLLVNDYGTPGAGAERVACNLRDGLAARGHRVRVFASRAALSPDASFADRACFGTTGRLQTLTSTLNVSAAVALAREVRAFRPDVVHVLMYRWQLSPAILPVLRGVPSVYYPMIYKAVCPTGSKLLPGGAPCGEPAGRACLRAGCVTLIGAAPLALQHALARAGHGVFDRVVAVSQAVRERLEADGLRVDSVVWPGTAVRPAREAMADRPTVSFAGRLVREKGVDVLLRAFAAVRTRVPDARLLLAGAGPDEKSLRALAASLGLGAAVAWLGTIPWDALGEALAPAWVHAVPSVWAEPFGLTATEAMMRGTAVVASRTGGLAESVDDGVTGLAVAPGDVPALAGALGALLADRALAEAMGAAGRARALALFTTDRCADRFEALYHEIAVSSDLSR